MTNQTRRRAVKDVAYGKGTVAGHGRVFLRAVGRATRWQRTQGLSLYLKRLADPPVASQDDVAHKPLVIRSAVEVAVAA